VMQSETVDFRLSGAHFQDGAQVACTPDGVAINSVTFVGDETIEVNVTIDADAPVGRYSLTVTNPDGGAGTFYSAIEVRAFESEDVASPGSEDDCACWAVGKASLPRPSPLQLMLTTE
jgi:hypothetical protein